MRNLILFVLVLVGIWWVRRALANKRARGGGAGRSARTEGGGKSARGMERMIECAHCGVHVPESEGLSEAGRFYCCDAHRRLGPGRGR